MISQAAIEAVTAAENVSPSVEPGAGVRAVRDRDVVAELRRLEGLSESEARQIAREAVVHVGGHVERGNRRAGRATGRIGRRSFEVWWVPRSVVRR